MRLIRGQIFDSNGQRHTVYGVRAAFDDGVVRIEDISPRRRDVLLFCLLLLHFSDISRSDIEDFAADYINLLSKYS